MIGLLQALHENTSIPEDSIWHITIAPDCSGELLLDETPVVTFDTQSEFASYVSALSGCEQTLTLMKICEVLQEIRR